MLKGKGLVKTVKFDNPRYIGDPINAVKIFNDLKADELVFLDITASKEKRCISVELVRAIGDEAFMPFGVGGGISRLIEIENIFKAGAEKVILNTFAILNQTLVTEAAKVFGSQSIVCSVDVKKNLFGKYEVFTEGGSKKIKTNYLDLVKQLEDSGAGELVINSIDHDGKMSGYDIGLISSVSQRVNIPVVACGGAGTLIDMKMAYKDGMAHALAAGSMFVYHGPRRAVLINYPPKNEVMGIFNDNIS